MVRASRCPTPTNCASTLDNRASSVLGCGFPVAHWLTMFDAESGLLVRQLATPLRTHDLSHVAQLHPELAAGDVLVGDTAFASYVHLALLLQAQLHGVFPVHQRQLVSFREDRKLVGQRPKGTVATQAASRLLRKLGQYDQLVEYAKPQRRPRWISQEAYQRFARNDRRSRTALLHQAPRRAHTRDYPRDHAPRCRPLSRRSPWRNCTASAGRSKPIWPR